MTLFNFQTLAPVLLLVWLPPEKQQFANEGEGDEKEKKITSIRVVNNVGLSCNV